MRLIHAVAALGLLVSHVLGQQWEDYGAMPDLSRRLFYEAFAHPASLAKRDGGCGTGQHPCSDINSTSCCSNDKYCIVNETTYKAQCCPLGSTCGGPCNTDQYYANETITTTVSGTASVETVFACVGRQCTSTNYLCAESFGGGCCQYGANCASGKVCLVPSTSSSSSAMSTVVSEIPEGCSVQGQTSCTAGGGCCNAGYVCTEVSSAHMCAKATSTSAASSTAAAPTGSGVTVEHTSSGLSTGAKAGIAVGVIVGAALITGALTWFCIRRRRSARSTTTGQEMHSDVGARPNGPNDEPDGVPRAYGAGYGPMSEAGGYPASSTQVSYSRSGPLPGLTSDYFGAEAGHGPYTEHAGDVTGTPEYHAQPVRQDGQMVHGPDNIVGPVEIDAGRPKLSSKAGSSEGSELEGTMVGDAWHQQQQQQQQQQRQQQYGHQASRVRDSIAGRFELYGTETLPDTRAPQPLGTPGSDMTSELGTPSPMSHEDQLQQQQQQHRRSD